MKIRFHICGLLYKEVCKNRQDKDISLVSSIDDDSLRQRVNGNGSIWNRTRMGTFRPCVYTGPLEPFQMELLAVPWSTYDVDPIWNRTQKGLL